MARSRCTRPGKEAHTSEIDVIKERMRRGEGGAGTTAAREADTGMLRVQCCCAGEEEVEKEQELCLCPLNCH
jgi:hypothetical protein